MYPSRETVLAYKALADRSPTLEMRVEYTKAAASMLGMWLEIYTNSTPEQIDKSLAGFDAWFEKHKDKIHFDKKGKLRLSRRGAAQESRIELSGEDRERIRGQAICVLRLMAASLGDGEDEDPESSAAAALNAQCGPALFGAERSALMARMATTASTAKGAQPREMAEEGDEGGEGSLELQAQFQGAESYPMTDAALLAAIYVVSDEADREALEMAEDLLASASRADVRRLAKGEPARVRKKALALAGKP